MAFQDKGKKDMRDWECRRININTRAYLFEVRYYLNKSDFATSSQSSQ